MESITVTVLEEMQSWSSRPLQGVYAANFIVCDGLKGLTESANGSFKRATSKPAASTWAAFRYASRKYWDQLARDMKANYAAVNADAVWAAIRRARGEVGKTVPIHRATVASLAGGVDPLPGRRRGDQARPHLGVCRCGSENSNSPDPTQDSPIATAQGSPPLDTQ